MSTLRPAAIGAALLMATAAFAHQGVKNATVKARMDAMSGIGDQMKVLGEMAKGKTGFDAALARQAAASVADGAARIPDLFAEPATDPKSEALPAIWVSFADFAAKGDAMRRAADDAAATIADPDTLRASVRAIGETCSACHKPYRK